MTEVFRKDKGFTLIELLVVIAIIALLLSVIMPALRLAKVQAQATVCAAHLKQFGLAWYFYTEDNDNTNIEYATTWSNGGFWFYKLGPYFGDEQFGEGIGDTRSGILKILNCPSTTKYEDLWNDGFGYGGARTAWQWATVDFSEHHEGGYTINGFMQDNRFDLVDERFYRKYDDARENVPMISDGGWVDAWPNRDIQEAPYAPTLIDLQGSGLPGTTYRMGTALPRLVIARHGKAVNVLFKGVNVERVQLEKLWSLPWYKGFEMVSELRLPAQ